MSEGILAGNAEVDFEAALEAARKTDRAYRVFDWKPRLTRFGQAKVGRLSELLADEDLATAASPRVRGRGRRAPTGKAGICRRNSR